MICFQTILAIEYNKEPEEEVKPTSPPPVSEPEVEQVPEPEPVKVAELEQGLQKLKVEMKKMQKNHREEMRNRDRKEIMIVCVVGACVM